MPFYLRKIYAFPVDATSCGYAAHHFDFPWSVISASSLWSIMEKPAA
jgi:hypothetical protein